jgi:tRNA-dihydrouridine synthase A
VLNGGLTDWDAIEGETAHVDGAMLGRVAYHDPYFLAQADARAFGDDAPARSRADILRAMIPYAERQLAGGVPLRGIARHMLGLYHGRSGGRRFRQILSDAAKLRDAGPELFNEALEAVEPVGAGDEGFQQSSMTL